MSCSENPSPDPENIYKVFKLFYLSLMDKSNLGDRIRALRFRKKLKQKDVARILGISRSTYAMYEMGMRSLPLNIIVLLAGFHEMTVDQLLDGDLLEYKPSVPARPLIDIKKTDSLEDQKNLKTYCKSLEEENMALKDELLRLYRKQSVLITEIQRLKGNQNP
jgi:transcriptional regulator with XRE-family HTH domain